MKYTFSVIVKKDDATAVADSLIVKEFKLRLVVTQVHRQRIEAIGIEAFITELLLAILKKKDDNNEDLVSQRFLDTLLEEFLDTSFHHPEDVPGGVSRHDICLKPEVMFDSKSELRCFAAFLPSLLRFTIVAEIAVGTLVDVGTYQLSESFLPISILNKQILAVTQTVLSALFNLFLVFSQPGMAFLRDFGAMVDGYLKKIVDKCRGRAAPDHLPVVVQRLPPLVSAKIALSQVFCCLLALNNFVTHVLDDYQQMVALKDTIIVNNEDAVVPALGTTIASWIGFGLNQLNDPIQLLCYVMMGFAFIRGYFSLGQVNRQGVQYIESDTGRWLSADEGSQLTVAVNPSVPVEAIEHGLAQFSPASITEGDRLRDTLLAKSSYDSMRD